MKKTQTPKRDLSARNSNILLNQLFKVLSVGASWTTVLIGTNRKPVCDFLLVISSNGVTAAYCSHFALFSFLNHPLGLRSNVRCSSLANWKARSGFPISDNWTFFAKCYGWGATGENRSKIGDFAPTRSVSPIISHRIIHPYPNFWRGKCNNGRAPSSIGRHQYCQYYNAAHSPHDIDRLRI